MASAVVNCNELDDVTPPLLQQHALATESTTPPPKLEKPVAVPQTSRGVGKPFARCYSESLAPFGVSKEQFVQFIDDLNTFTAGSPIFDYVDAAGNVVGNIPDIMTFGVQTGVSVGISASAQIGQGVVSYIRERRFTKEMNKDFFEPRNLKVDVLSGKKLRAKLGLAPDAPLSLPLSATEGLSSHQNLLAALDGSVGPLSFDVPPPRTAVGTLDGISARNQRRALAAQDEKALRTRERYRKETERYRAALDRKQQRLDESLAALEAKRREREKRRDERRERAMGREGKDRDRKLREIERDFRDDVGEIDRRVRELHKEYEEDVREKREALDELDEDEAYNATKLYWILVQNL
ncbi:hypothetical protein HIM_01204 [Hirsutella minnesotensis 3608]|nr:hypothetical protein HIM_01204 [Hirsutella minnesotensis 3608]